jgi:hypothetical protein
MFWRKTKPLKMEPLPIPTGLASNLLPLADEINRIHESCLWGAQGQFEQTKLWRALNLVFGVPAAALAAIAGGTGLAGNETHVPGVLALVSAGFAAALTTLNPSRRVTQSQASANAYLELQTAARQLLLVKLETLSYEDALVELEALTDRRDDTNKTADPPSTYAYWRAKKNITQDGGQTYLTETTKRKK